MRIYIYIHIVITFSGWLLILITSLQFPCYVHCSDLQSLPALPKCFPPWKIETPALPRVELWQNEAWRNEQTQLRGRAMWGMLTNEWDRQTKKGRTARDCLTHFEPLFGRFMKLLQQACQTLFLTGRFGKKPTFFRCLGFHHAWLARAFVLHMPNMKERALSQWCPYC